MKTRYYTATSLDGYIATTDHSIDWLYALGDFNDTSYPEFIKDVACLAMGSSTYQWLLRNVIQPADKPGEPWPYEQPCWVFSSREQPRVPGVDGADIRFVRGDVRPVHEAMRKVAGERNIWVVGGGDLVGQFHDAGLLDEVIVQVCSVTLGEGMPLLPRKIVAPTLRLTSARAIGPGFAELRYDVKRQ